MAVFALLALVVFFYFSTFEWRPLQYFCTVLGHRWYFCISTPTLKSGEVYCVRCGKVEFHKDGGWRL